MSSSSANANKNKNQNKNQKPSKIKLTYFNIEGVAEQVRLALALAKVPYDDDRIAGADWPALKPKTPFGKLPILILDDNPDLSQAKTESNAMLRYVGQFLDDSHTLYPSDDAASFWAMEQTLGLVADLRQTLAPCVYIGMRPEQYGYPAGFGQTEVGQTLLKTLRTTWMEQEFPKFMNYFVTLLGDKPWMASTEHPTIADCAVVAVLRYFTKGVLDHIPPTCVEEQFPKLADYVKRFCALPELQGRYQDGLR